MAFARHLGGEAQHKAQRDKEGNMSAKRGVLVVVALTLAADIAFFVLLAPRKGFDLSFALFLCGLIVCLDEYASWSLVTGARSERGADAHKVLLKKTVKYFVLALCASILFEALTLFGAPQVSALDFSAWNLKRVAFAFFVALSTILIVRWLRTGQEKCKIPHEIHHGFSTVGAKQIVMVIVCALLCVVLCVALVLTGRSLRGAGLFSVAIFLSVSALVLSGRNMGSHPEYAVFVIIVAFGMCISLSLPAVTRISWDDQIHYERTRAVSYVVDPAVSQAEETLTSPWVIDPALSQVVSTVGEEVPMTSVPSGLSDKTATWSQFDFDTYENALDQKVAHGSYGIDRNASYFKYPAIGYLPAATGLWFSRVLHLPLTWQFVVGKLFNLLFYATVCFAAIRILPRKKMLASVVALLPTNVFLASNYTYDTWVTCLLILATALVYREIVYSEVCLSGKNAVKIGATFLLALGPKAIYFPLVGIAALLPRSKYSDNRKRRAFVGFFVAVAIVVLLSFVLPFMMTTGSGVETGDTRGGAGVSSPGQVHFVLSNPLLAFNIFTSFILETWISLPGSDSAASFFAYLGLPQSFQPALSGVPAFLVALACVLDNRKTTGEIGVAGKVWTAVLAFVCMYGIVAALYVSFTPVGLHQVNGVQGRYLLPLVFPLAAILGDLKVENKYSKGACELAFCGASVFVIAACIWLVITSKLLM